MLCRLVFLLLLLVMSSTHALECFTCSSHIGIPNTMNDCERFNFYENHRKSVCLPGEQVCAKFVVNHDGMVWVHRSCKPYDVCEYLRSRYVNERGRDQLLECSTCSDKNLCNSAHYFSTSIFVFLIHILVILTIA